MEVLHLPRFGLEVRPDRSRVVLVVGGELDIATAPAFREAVDELWEVGWCEIGVDVSAVTFVDSSGLATLLHVCREAKRDGRGLTVTASCAPLERLLALSGLKDALPRVT